MKKGVMKNILCFVFISFLLGSWSVKDASAIFDVAGEMDWIQDIKLKVNESKSFQVNELKRVAVGNPDVLDVPEVKENEVVIAAKADGASTFVYWDKFGEHSYRVRVFSADLFTIQKRIERILTDTGITGVKAKVNEDERKIFLSGTVLNEKEKENLKYVLGTLYEHTVDTITTEESRISIEIDVQILELTKADVDKMGVDWTLGGTSPFTTITENPFAGTDAMNAAKRTTQIFRVGYLTRSEVEAQINLLVQRGKGRILSRPKLVCLSGKEAEFLVGGEVPVVTTNSIGTNFTTSVQYKKFGISLKVQPTYVKGDAIDAKLVTEVSDVDLTNNYIEASGIKIPAFDTRRAESQLFINDGQTVFLAGLIKNKDAETLKRWPALGDMPILGMLFRSKNFTNNQTELVITMTPHVVKAQAPDVLRQGALGNSGLDRDGSGLSVSSGDESIDKYARSVQQSLSFSAYYPKIARDAGWEGVVKLSLHILNSGQLDEVRLIGSSGYKVLDDAAVSTAKGMSPYPPFPSYIEKADLWIEVPIIYKGK